MLAHLDRLLFGCLIVVCLGFATVCIVSLILYVLIAIIVGLALYPIIVLFTLPPPLPAQTRSTSLITPLAPPSPLLLVSVPKIKAVKAGPRAPKAVKARPQVPLGTLTPPLSPQPSRNSLDRIPLDKPVRERRPRWTDCYDGDRAKTRGARIAHQDWAFEHCVFRDARDLWGWDDRGDEIRGGMTPNHYTQALRQLFWQEPPPLPSTDGSRWLAARSSADRPRVEFADRHRRPVRRSPPPPAQPDPRPPTIKAAIRGLFKRRPAAPKPPKRSFGLRLLEYHLTDRRWSETR